MKIQSINDKILIKEFLVAASGSAGAEFLASSQWADVLRSEGETPETLGVFSDDEELVAIFNQIKVRSVYNYLPRGPVFKNGLTEEIKKSVWQFLNKEFRKQGIIFFRVEPIDLPLVSYKQSRNLQPKETLLLDLGSSEDELQSSFHPKTRYNIKLAQKKGVRIREGIGAGDFEKFWELMTETGKRDAFKIHNKKHYQTLATANTDFIKLFLAEFEGRVIAAGLFSFYGDKVTYLHGASSHASRQLMAPFLLQWTIIKMAKDLSYKFYDFYGIDEQKWPGVTRFKLGFSGFRVSYAGTLDIILNKPKYYLYNLMRRIKRYL